MREAAPERAAIEDKAMLPRTWACASKKLVDFPLLPALPAKPSKLVIWEQEKKWWAL